MKNLKKILNKSLQTESPKDLLKVLKEIKDPVIEIGGPTKKGYPFIGIKNLKSFFKKGYISNIVREDYDYDEKGNLRYEKLDVDFLADARNLPFKDETIGAVFCSCLPKVAYPPDINLNERAKFIMVQLTPDMIKGKEEKI